MAEQDGTGTPERLPPHELAAISGPTFVVNRSLVQKYPDGSLRLVFAEQYSGEPEALGHRGALFMQADVAEFFAHQLAANLGFKLVPAD